ncbi:MAG TPA: SCO family protein [Gaiellaceae bacterium]|nr:SCO family protein [Gaiellaceae bacterium]
MAAQPPSVTAPRPGRRLVWALWAGVALVGLAAVAGLLLLGRGSGSSSAGLPPASELPSATWAAGAVRAPAFRLSDEAGRPVSLSALSGRPVLVTFIDPLCRNFCPIEAQHLNDAVHALPAGSKPAIVAVSVNVYGNTRANLLQDNRKWKLVPQWHWGVSGGAQLARVWKSYHIAVLVTTKKIAGVSVHDVAHTEAAYLIDRSGYERALFLWPYRAAAVVRAIEALR